MRPHPAPAGSAASAALTANLYGGAMVSYGGHNRTAKWWTQGDIPGNNSQGVWTDDGACKS